jgi:hypothetical protein
MASAEYYWLQEHGDLIAAAYPQKWIAVDGTLISEDPESIATIVVGTGNTLQEAISSIDSTKTPLSLFYAFIRTPLESHVRQEGQQGGNQRFI